MRTNLPIVTAFVLGGSLLAPLPLQARQGRPAVPQGPAGTVTLTVGDYDRLIDRAAQPIARPDPPPVAAVVGRSELRARVDGGMVRGTLRLEGEVFARGQVKVPLVSGATLVDAKSDGRVLPLLQEGNTHAAVFAGPAPFAAVVEWAASLGAAPGRASFMLPQPVAGSVAIVVDLPGDPADVRAQPGLITRKQSTAGRTIVEIAPAPGAATQLSWSVREGAPALPNESRILADVKSLVTIGDGDLRMASIVDITVVQGEPRTFTVQAPAGYEVASVTGGTVESHEIKNGLVVVTVREPGRRRHQFLLGLEQAHSSGSFKIDTSFPTVLETQRESGEAAIEGTGTIEVNASGDDGLRRMDVREASPALRSLARQSMLAAFRYQRRQNERRIMTLDVRRFADAAVIAAAADHAVATTLVTSEGRMLTEVALRIRNRAQPFMKVTLPPGATMLSAEVAGETARPVEGGGLRIPLLRAGFRPDGPYPVSFVYLHAGQAFAKRGEAEMALAKIDVPISVLEWELFLPERYSAKPIGGNVIPARLVHLTTTGRGAPAGRPSDSFMTLLDNASPGEIVGRVTDAMGQSIPGATIALVVDGRAQQSTVSDANGAYVLRGVPSGTVTITSELTGFASARRTFGFDRQARRLDFQMQVAALNETVTVTAEAPPLPRDRATSVERDPGTDVAAQQAPSQNIMNLQKRVAGVLPIRIDVPRSGSLYSFFRPLVFEEETTVAFRYKTR